MALFGVLIIDCLKTLLHVIVSIYRDECTHYLRCKPENIDIDTKKFLLNAILGHFHPHINEEMAQILSPPELNFVIALLNFKKEFFESELSTNQTLRRSFGLVMNGSADCKTLFFNLLIYYFYF